MKLARYRTVTEQYRGKQTFNTNMLSKCVFNMPRLHFVIIVFICKIIRAFNDFYIHRYFRIEKAPFHLNMFHLLIISGKNMIPGDFEFIRSKVNITMATFETNYVKHF